MGSFETSKIVREWMESINAGAYRTPVARVVVPPVTGRGPEVAGRD